MAASRFETGEVSPLQARAKIDFTITVPAFVSLGINVRLDGTGGTNAAGFGRATSLERSIVRIAWVQAKGPSQLYVVGNAGTLAVNSIESVSIDRLQESDRKNPINGNSLVVYSVSMP